MFLIPVYAAILTNRQLADIITLHDTFEAAKAQCGRWVDRHNGRASRATRQSSAPVERT